MKKAVVVLLCAVAWGVLSPHGARADFIVTGNPLNDGWNLVGNSRALGVYVRGSADFDYNLFRFTSTIDSAANPLIANFAGTGWQAGDILFGTGGFIVDQGNPNLGANVRTLAKYGTSTSTFSASSTTTPPGDGNTSFSGGFGGTGSIQLSVSTGTTVEANAGSPRLPDAVNRFDGVNSVAASLDLGRYIFTYSGGKLLSWEWVLNQSLLGRLGLAPPGPNVGDRFIATVQAGGGTSTDSIGLLPQLSPTAAIPEPSSLLMTALAAAGLAVFGRRRFRR